jgi:hypothetical protein
MNYIIPIGNGSFVSAKNGWFCVSCAVTRESLGYRILLVDNGRIPGTRISNTPLLRGVDFGFSHVVFEVWLLG